MKINLKSVVRYSNHEFELFQNNQIVFSIGNFLGIKQIDRSQFEFLNLDNKIDHLYCFKTAIHKKPTILTAQRSHNNIDICCYTLNGQRKVVRITDGQNFLPLNQIISFNIIPDQLEPSAVYGYARTKTDSVLFLVDIVKGKLMSIGYNVYFQDMKVILKHLYGASVCGKGLLKVMKPFNDSWECQDRLPKRLTNQHLFLHEWINLQDLICCSQTEIFVINQMDVIQTIQINSNITLFRRVINGLFILSQGHKVTLYSKQAQDKQFIFQAQKQIILEKDTAIIKALVNNQKDTIFIATNKFQLFSWKSQNLTDQNDALRFQLTKHQQSAIRFKQGAISTSYNKNYALIVQGNFVSLWDLQKSKTIIKMEFTNLDQICSAMISPDGYSMVIALNDRIKFYKILIQAFRCYGQFPFKKCRLISYSHGGQLVTFCSGRGLNSTITIMNTIYLKEVFQIKHIDPIQIAWNQYDDQLVICTRRSALLCYKIAEKSKLWEIQLQQIVNYIRFDFTSGRLLVSTNSIIYSILNQKSIDKITLKIPHFAYVFPVEGIYLAVTKNGILYYSSSLDFNIYNDIRVFLNKPFDIIYKKSRLIAYSGLSDILVMSFGKTELKPSLQSQLALIEKEQMQKVFEKVRTLQSLLENLQVMVFAKIQEEKKKYNASIDCFKQKFEIQLQKIETKYQGSIAQKNKQQKGFNRLLNQVQTSQLQSVRIVEKIYDEKLRLARQKYCDLEQQSIEMQIHNETIFKQLKLRHQQDIENIRKKYQEKLQSQFINKHDLKVKQIDYKKKMEAKMINLEQQSQLTLFYLQNHKNQEIKTLLGKFTKLERQFNNSNIQKHNLQQKYNYIECQYEKSKKTLHKNQQQLDQYKSKLNLLEEEIKAKNAIIQQKNLKIEEQRQKIQGLQKTKQVLNFRTVEVRKELEPKETLVEKLKSQLFKVDEQYSKQKKKCFKLNQKIQKIQKLIQFTKKQLQKQKGLLKNRARKHQELCSEIFKLVNNLDQSKWCSAIVEIYRHHVQNVKHQYDSIMGQDKNVTDQINKNLIHVQKSLIQANTRNQKALKQSQLDKIRKMRQNANLIFDLNNMRKMEKQYVSEIKFKDIEIDKLNKQISFYSKSNRGSTTINTGDTHKIGKRRASRLAYTPNLQIQLNTRNTPETLTYRQRVFSASKTMRVNQSKRSKPKMTIDLVKELELANNQIKKQSILIDELNQRFLSTNEHFTE